MQIMDTDPDSPEALFCLRAYYALLLENIKGITADMLVLPLPDALKYRAPRGAFLLALSDEGAPLGCLSLRRLAAEEAELKRLWVDPEARGQGIARALMSAIEPRARSLGYRSLKLDSNSALTPAVALYQSLGWADCPAYTGPPADVWMSKQI